MIKRLGFHSRELSSNPARRIAMTAARNSSIINPQTRSWSEYIENVHNYYREKSWPIDCVPDVFLFQFFQTVITSCRWIFIFHELFNCTGTSKNVFYISNTSLNCLRCKISKNIWNFGCISASSMKNRPGRFVGHLPLTSATLIGFRGRRVSFYIVRGHCPCAFRRYIPRTSRGVLCPPGTYPWRVRPWAWKAPLRQPNRPLPGDTSRGCIPNNFKHNKIRESIKEWKMGAYYLVLNWIHNNIL